MTAFTAVSAINRDVQSLWTVDTHDVYYLRQEVM